MAKGFISVKEFRKTELEQKKTEIIEHLEKIECQKIEFLRGALFAYSELIKNTKWDVREINNPF